MLFASDLSSEQVKPILESYLPVFMSNKTLAELFNAGVIRTDHPYNCGYAYRDAAQDVVIYQQLGGKRFPSGGVKFGVDCGQIVPTTHHCTLYHGNICGSHLASILTTGLGAPQGSTEGLATRSPQLAGECYGFHVQLSDGLMYVVYVQLASAPPVRYMVNSFDCAWKADGTLQIPGTRMRDTVLTDDQLECVVEVMKTYVTGLIIQQYSTPALLARIAATATHPWRKKHLSGNIQTLVGRAGVNAWVMK